MRTGKLLAVLASMALCAPVIGAQQAKAPAAKPAASQGTMAAKSKTDTAKAKGDTAAKAVAKSTSTKGKSHKASTKHKAGAKDSTKAAPKKP